jgi:hypothetical protein
LEVSVGLEKLIECLDTLGIPFYTEKNKPDIVFIPDQDANGEPYLVAGSAKTPYEGRLIADYLTTRIISKVPNLPDKVMYERHALTPGVKYIYVRKRAKYAVEANIEFVSPEKDPLILLLRLNGMKKLMGWRAHDRNRSKDAPSRN